MSVTPIGTAFSSTVHKLNTDAQIGISLVLTHKSELESLCLE